MSDKIRFPWPKVKLSLSQNKIGTARSPAYLGEKRSLKIPKASSDSQNGESMILLANQPLHNEFRLHK